MPHPQHAVCLTCARQSHWSHLGSLWVRAITEEGTEDTLPDVIYLKRTDNINTGYRLCSKPPISQAACARGLFGTTGKIHLIREHCENWRCCDCLWTHPDLQSTCHDTWAMTCYNAECVRQMDKISPEPAGCYFKATLMALRHWIVAFFSTWKWKLRLFY